MSKPSLQPWRIIVAEIIAAMKADPGSLRSIYDDREFRPARNASVWAQLSARLAQARKAYREAVAKGCLKEVQHTMLRRCFAHDYTLPGSYMITLVVPDRGSNPFGTAKGCVRPGAAGAASVAAATRVAAAHGVTTSAAPAGVAAATRVTTSAAPAGVAAARGVTTSAATATADPSVRKGTTLTPAEVAAYAHLRRTEGPLRLELTDLGAVVLEALDGIPANYPMVEVRKAQIMPDHLHMILVVHAPIVSRNGKPRHLGHVIAGYKKGCNRAYWQLTSAGKPLSTAALPGTAALKTLSPLACTTTPASSALPPGINAAASVEGAGRFSRPVKVPSVVSRAQKYLCLEILFLQILR